MSTTREVQTQIHIDAADMERMRQNPGNWRCYQNLDLHSTDFGKLEFKVDDSPAPTGWQWTLIGFVNIETGKVWG